MGTNRTDLARQTTGTRRACRTLRAGLSCRTSGAGITLRACCARRTTVPGAGAGITRRARGRGKEFPVSLARQAGRDLAGHLLPRTPCRAVIEHQFVSHIGGRSAPLATRDQRDWRTTGDTDHDGRLAGRGQLDDAAARHIGKVTEIECTRRPRPNRRNTAIEGEERTGIGLAAKLEFAGADGSLCNEDVSRRGLNQDHLSRKSGRRRQD